MSLLELNYSKIRTENSKNKKTKRKITTTSRACVPQYTCCLTLDLISQTNERNDNNIQPAFSGRQSSSENFCKRREEKIIDFVFVWLKIVCKAVYF